MADWVALADLGSTRADPARRVAVRGGLLLYRAAFQRGVGAWQAAWAAAPRCRRVGLYLDDPFDFACALFGAWHAGKQPWLPGDTRSDTVARLLQQVDACAGDLPGAVRAAECGAAPPAATLPAEAGLVVFTSGSTGAPVALHKSLAQLEAELRALEAAFGSALDGAAPATVHASVSHQHIYGLLFRLLWPLAAGRAFDCERLRYPEQLARLADAPAAVLVSSPALLGRLGGLAPLPGQRGSGAGLRAVFSSGGPLAPTAAAEVEALLGRSPTEVYGSSETGGIAWRRGDEHGAHGGVWQPLPAVEWKIDDGLLSVRSPHLPTPGWQVIQDRVAAAGSTGFVLLGRADRIVKIEEKRVSLGAIERLLAALPEIAQARALVLPGPVGARVAVVAVPTAAGWATQARIGRRAMHEMLRAALAPAVEPVGLPRRFRLVQALPVDDQGKVTDRRLAALFRPFLPPVEWLRREADQASGRLGVSADLAVFDGHFPGMPVLPGVAQIDWAIAFARQCFALPERFLRAEQVKFLRPVCPPLALTLELQWSAASGCLRFALGSSQGAHASGRLWWERQGDG